MSVLTKYNNLKQEAENEKRALEQWEQSVNWSGTKKSERSNKVNNTHASKVRSIKKLNGEVAEAFEESVSLDNTTQENVINIISTLNTLNVSHMGAALLKLDLGPKQPFENPEAYNKRKQYEEMDSKARQKPTGKSIVLEYKSELCKHAHSSCTGANLPSTQLHQTIAQRFQTETTTHGSDATIIHTKLKEQHKSTNKKTQEKRRNERKAEIGVGIKEDALAQLEWIIIKEHNHRGKRKLMECSVAGDQLSIKPVEASGKRKMKKRKSY